MGPAVRSVQVAGIYLSLAFSSISNLQDISATQPWMWSSFRNTKLTKLKFVFQPWQPRSPI